MGLAGWPASPRDPHVCLPVSGLQACATLCCSLCGCWEPGPGLYACSMHYLPAKPPPSPMINSFYMISLLYFTIHKVLSGRPATVILHGEFSMDNEGSSQQLGIK